MATLCVLGNPSPSNLLFACDCAFSLNHCTLPRSGWILDKTGGTETEGVLETVGVILGTEIEHWPIEGAHDQRWDSAGSEMIIPQS